MRTRAANSVGFSLATDGAGWRCATARLLLIGLLLVLGPRPMCSEGKANQEGETGNSGETAQKRARLTWSPSRPALADEGADTYRGAASSDSRGVGGADKPEQTTGENGAASPSRGTRSTPVSLDCPRTQSEIVGPIQVTNTPWGEADEAFCHDDSVVYSDSPDVDSLTQTAAASTPSNLSSGPVSRTQSSAVLLQPTEGDPPSATMWPSRRRVLVRPPLVKRDPFGRLVVKPDVKVFSAPGSYEPPKVPVFGPNPIASFPRLQPPGPDASDFGTGVGAACHLSEGPIGLSQDWANEVPETTPLPADPPLFEATPDAVYSAEPIFDEVIQDASSSQGHVSQAPPLNAGTCHYCTPGHPPPRVFWHRGPLASLSCLWCRLKCFSSPDVGVGQERLIHAPFQIDTTQPLNNYRVRFDFAYDHTFPDRAEYFWAKIAGRGPKEKEQSVDYQDIRFLFELGGPKFSAATEIPIRILDPIGNANTAGLGDLNLTTKLVLVDGTSWQITQMFRTYFNTGLAARGLGTGHISLEPGVLFRYRWNDKTYLHSDLKFWFPIGGDPEYSGPVLGYGFGVSHLLFDTDTFAVIPVLELVNWTVLDGKKTTPDSGTLSVDGDQICNIHPGLRVVWDTGGDLGLVEFGIAGGLSPTKQHWYDSLLRVDLRCSYY
jgi:hypothetical protein